jgi:hypothetical protein
MSTEGNVEMVSTVIYTVVFFIISHPLYIKNEFSVYVLSMKEACILAILHKADLLDMTHCRLARKMHSCVKCNFSLRYLSKLVIHFRFVHQHEHDFQLSSGVDGCSRTYKQTNSFIFFP